MIGADIVNTWREFNTAYFDDTLSLFKSLCFRTPPGPSSVQAGRRVVASSADEYRRLARECLEIAHPLSVGEPRTILLQMAQVWQRLADQQRTAAQEKQPVQPKRR